MSVPTIEVLYFDGCPGYAAEVPAVHRIASTDGVDVDTSAAIQRSRRRADGA